jgi:hypothetical protein
MRKALIPMFASLALCGAGVLGLIASNARAQANPDKPVMVPLLGSDLFFAQPLTDIRSASQTTHPFATDPKQFCDDNYASEVGHMAYLETRLRLTNAEQPLFARWKDVRLDIAKRRAADCSAHASGQDHADPVARMNREEEMLKQRVADLDAERPAFSTLYRALAPEQRQSLMPERTMVRFERGAIPFSHEMGGFPPLPPPPGL